MKNKKSILVTGGLGFIGSHTVVELITSDYDVIIVDNLSNSDESVLTNIEKITGKSPVFFKTNLCDSKELKVIFDTNKIEAVFHFASSIYVDESMKNPLDYYNNNLVSLLNLLSLMKENAVNKLIFSSSCTVYGQPNKLPISEETPIQDSASPYGRTKVMAETMLKDISEMDSSIQTISLRYFNPVGAHESGLIGERQGENPKHLFPLIMEVLNGKRKDVKIFGTDYNTKDGSAIRDYIHVVDIAKAHVLGMEAFDNDIPYQFFNLGTGKGFSVIEIIKEFEQSLDITVPHELVGRREGDIAEIWANTDKAKKELNWEAKLSLNEMILSAYNWNQTKKMEQIISK